ncbi:unnamed protein product [Protopolystoma xenopodis]|uniref:Uncharacterized protein n=1 Tax=Protopolystoma xenopodis TaxID=117903 RepID=A0A3S5FD56_9PLAT|nr:unnamed protein product [Protopolystoma xenopodis]
MSRRLGTCNIKKGDEMYANEELRWKEMVGCQCQPRIKNKLTVCGCRKKASRTLCINGNIKQTLEVTTNLIVGKGNSSCVSKSKVSSRLYLMICIFCL